MIQERLSEIAAELNQFEDEFLKYSFLVELSAYVNPNQPDLMTKNHLHEGCQSQVWMSFQEEDGLFLMRAMSDTLIIRGVLYVIMELFNGLSVKEISENKINFLEDCGIEQHFSSERVAGISSIISAIYDFCSRRT